LIALVAVILFATIFRFADAQVGSQFAGILTNRYDNSRDGLNSLETILTPSNVTAQFFGKLFSNSVDGNIYAETLYVPGVTINGQTHNVVYVATEHDSVYAFDADAGAAPLWQTSFINPANGITTVNSNIVSAKNSDPGCVDINPEYGITASPVIDPSTNTIYVLANTDENGTITYRLHALDITTGQEKFGGPVLIQASSTGSGDDGDVFDPTQELGRAALLLVNGVVYLGFGSHCDLDPWHGWLLGYSASNLSQMYVYNVTSNGSEGAIWGAGTGPSSDQSGDIYVATGNGTFDENTGGVDFGDTYLRMGVRNNAFGVVDFFTPFNDASLQDADYDLGSTGLVMLPDQSTGPTHIAVGAGKEGEIYLVNRDNLGQFNATSDNVLYEVPSPSENNILNWATPAYFNGNIYFIMSQDVARSYSISNDTLTLASQGTHTFPFLGSQPVISANGTTNGILWTLESTTGSGIKPVAGVLHAYNPANLAQEYYKSTQNGSQDVPGPAVKFTVPTVANGKVYVGSTTELDIYGTTAVKITAPANEATVSGTVSISITNAAGVSWSDFYIDGSYLASTPPSTVSWSSSSVPDGPHTISATAFNSTGTVLGEANLTVTVHNGSATPTATAHATTTAIATPNPTTTATAVRTSTIVATPTSTGVRTATTTPTAVRTATIVATPTATAHATTTATANPTPTVTAHPTTTATANPTTSATAVRTATIVATPTATPTSSAVQISAPANGATVSGTTTISAIKGSGVTWINVYIDGNYFASTPPNSFSWNTTTVANGSHTISANAYNSSGVVLGTASITVTVNNSGATPTATAHATTTATANQTPTVTAHPTATATATTHPTTTATANPTTTATAVRTSTIAPTPTPAPTPGEVQITAPSNGATVSGTVSITVSKASNVSWLDVYIDGSYFSSTPPSTFSWTSSSVANGSHTISATAFSSAGSVLGTASITVNVSN